MALDTENDLLLFEANATVITTVDPTVIFGPRRDSLYVVVPITVMYILIFFTGIVGNICTCIVIVRNKSMHTATNYYLFSLAVSDLLLLISGMPQEVYSIWLRWPYAFGATFCVLRGLAAETSTNASILTIALFTTERYLAICHPFHSHKMSKLSRATKHVFLLWVVAFLLALPQALQFGLKSHKGVTMCLQTRVIVEHSFEISTFVFFLAPMVLITVLYFLIGLKLKETREVETIRGSRIYKKKHGKSTRRVVKMLVAVVVAFFLCWAPFHAQRLVYIYGSTENHLARSPAIMMLYSIVTYASGILYYMSTCINPILYHIMSHKFRSAFKNTLLWCFYFGKHPKTERYPGTFAFAKVPTSSCSDQNAKNAKNETCFYEHIAEPKKFSRKSISKRNSCDKTETNELRQVPDNNRSNNDIKKQEDQNTAIVMETNKGPDVKEKTAESKSENLRKLISLDKSNPKAFYDTISNSSLKTGKTEELREELDSYLFEIKKGSNKSKGLLS